MIQPNELRIGNFILYRSHYVGAVRAVSGTIEINEIEGPHVCQSIDPIPITEDWLMKFGFDNINGVFVQPDNNLYTIKPAGNTKTIWWFFISKHKMPIMYVHQLQNIYFALTCEELQLKLTIPWNNQKCQEM